LVCGPNETKPASQPLESSAPVRVNLSSSWLETVLSQVSFKKACIQGYDFTYKSFPNSFARLGFAGFSSDDSFF